MIWLEHRSRARSSSSTTSSHPAQVHASDLPQSPLTPSSISQKAIREAIAILKSHPEAELVGIVQLVDRQERGQQGTGSTVQEVEKEFDVPVVSIIALDDIVRYMEGRDDMKEKLEQMKAYRAQWGITPQ